MIDGTNSEKRLDDFEELQPQPYSLLICDSSGLIIIIYRISIFYFKYLDVNVDETDAMIDQTGTGGHEQLEQEASLKHKLSVSDFHNPQKIPCVDCCLLAAIDSIDIVLSEKLYTPVTVCRKKCTVVNDSISVFVNALFKKVEFNDCIPMESLEDMTRNIQSLIASCQGRKSFLPSFYTFVLENVHIYTVASTNKIIYLINSALKEFDREIINPIKAALMDTRAARRGIRRFLSFTGDIRGFLSMIEILYSFNKHGMDLTMLLPKDMMIPLNTLSVIDQRWRNNKVFDAALIHTVFCQIAEDLISTVFKEHMISVVRLGKKERRNELSSENFGNSELILFYNKQEHFFQHFCYFNDDSDDSLIALAEKLPLNSETRLFNEKLVIEVGDWIFCIKDQLTGSTFVKTIQSDLDKLMSVNDDSCVNDFDKLDQDKKVVVKETSHGDIKESTTLYSQFIVQRSELEFYWDASKNSNPKMKERRFNTTRIGFDWPRFYGSPCVVIVKYNHALKFNSHKNVAFANITGVCKICNSTHMFKVPQSPFAESLAEDGRVQYRPIKDMIVDVSVSGTFHETNGVPDIKRPVHEKDDAAGYHLKGEERQLMADYATNKGVASAYTDQFAFMNKNEMSKFNITSVRSREVIKQAMHESEKKLRGGATVYEAIRTVYLQQKSDYSPHYERTAASVALPGIVRKFEEEPLKVYFANYDQLKLGATYLNNNEDSVVNLDSSGKFWQHGSKVGKNALNSALVIPPVAKGHSPFPIFETISYSNKTIDFLQFLQYAWYYMSKAINNEKVNFPSVAVSDFSWPNLHAFCEYLDKTTVDKYLEASFKSLNFNEVFPYATVITICKNHNIPTFLKTARAMNVDKRVADTFVCGLMKVLEVSIRYITIVNQVGLTLIHKLLV